MRKQKDRSIRDRGPFRIGCLILGGFHLKGTAPAEIAAIVQALRCPGVEHVGPCHCTGEQAIAAFAEAYGDDFVAIAAIQTKREKVALVEGW
jgi:metal-dependent hydrolase (beta-lactamase superfamily II)